jgi:NADH:ubiquinone oxidoreductase subunit C
MKKNIFVYYLLLFKYVKSIFVYNKSLIILYIYEKNIHFVLNIIKYSKLFDNVCLSDIWISDISKYSNNFELNRKFISYKTHTYFVIKTCISKNEPFCNSINLFFSSSNWLERECWDMFGIYFLGHNDLRRILTDYGFEGHPLKKDFPLSGYIEIRYNEFTKCITSDHIHLTQEYRLFDFLTPWEKIL